MIIKIFVMQVEGWRGGVAAERAWRCWPAWDSCTSLGKYLTSRRLNTVLSFSKILLSYLFFLHFD